MTKKQNTLLFILAGTIVSILITLLILVISVFIGAKFFPSMLESLLPFLFTVAVLFGMLIYNKLVTLVVKKFNLEDKIEPLFKKRKKPVKKDT